jgi:hypothetical protein
MLDSKVLGEFDHVKKGLKLDDEGLIILPLSFTLGFFSFSFDLTCIF